MLIVVGALLLAAGLCWPWLSMLPLGRLPGDIVVDRPGFKLVIPLTTMLLVSALLTLVVWIVRCFGGGG